MTKISIEEDLLNRLLAKCSAEIERHAGSADSANITFEKNRCVKTLFPKSSCTQCVQVCREQALSIKDQTISIENSECSACGACIRACPTETFSYGRFPLFGVLAALKNRLHSASASSALAFTCPKAQSRKNGVPVGCFNGVNPALILLSHLLFNTKIELHSSDCERCPSHNGGCPTQALADDCETLCAKLGVQFRPVCAEENDGDKISLGRRRIFSRLSDRLHGISEITSLSGGAPKTDKVFTMPKREMLIAAIELLKARRPGFEISEKIFPLPGVISGKCSGCNICTLLCPTGCLSDKTENGRFKLTADPMRCTNCRRCIEACPTQAMVMRGIPGTQAVISDSVRIVLTEISAQKDEEEQSAEARMKEIFDVPIYRS